MARWIGHHVALRNDPQEAPTVAFRLIESRTTDLTREMAKEHMELPPSPTERELKKERLKYLQEKREQGQLIPFNWAVAKVDGQIFRANGQHSSHDLSSLNGNFPAGLKVHLDTFECDTMDDLALLFRQFDSRFGARSQTDIAGAYKGIHPELNAVPTASAKVTAEAIRFYRADVQGVWAQAGDDIFSYINEPVLHPFILWVGIEVLSIKTPELKSKPVVAAMYATFIANEPEARAFWQDVARGGPAFDDAAPASMLDTWLKSLRETKNTVPLKPGQVYQGCIYAWNAYREEKRPKSIQYDLRKGPLEVTH